MEGFDEFLKTMLNGDSVSHPLTPQIKAALDDQTSKGTTPLGAAIHYGRTEVIELLKELGARTAFYKGENLTVESEEGTMARSSTSPFGSPASSVSISPPEVDPDTSPESVSRRLPVRKGRAAASALALARLGAKGPHLGIPDSAPPV